MKITCRTKLLVVALVLCMTTMIGSTLAWFTDTVESGINTIESGNLDIELYHTNKTVTNENVGENTKLFEIGENTLWEPGMVTWENLTVENKGNLNLEYALGINVSDENFVSDTEYGLSGALKLTVLDNAITATSREEVIAMAKDGKSLTSTACTDALAPGESKDYGVIIYWEPTADDNNWNVNNGKTTTDGEPLHITLGVKLIATQEAAESDSFGPDYDENAMIVVKTAAEAQAALDAATPGAVIKLAPGVEYGTLYLRPVAGQANTITDCNYLVYGNEMLRKVENITIVGAPGATVDAIKVVAGHIEGSTGYVVDIQNLVIDSVEFNDDHTNPPHSYAAPVFFDLTYTNVNGLTVKNCKLIGNNATMNFVYLYGSGRPTNSTFETAAKNITITGNTVDGIARLCELRQAENVTITNNTIKNTALHGMLLAVDGGTYAGNVTITGNTAENINERFVRMAGAGDAVVVIKDNTIVNYMGADSNHIKVTDGNNVTIENNPVSVGVKDAAALRAALAEGGTIVLANDIAMTESISMSNANFVLDGNGHTITMTEDATNTYALFDITGGKATIKNVIFDGIKEGAVVRTAGVEFNLDNVTAKNGNHTQQQGLFRLMGKNTITNCTFTNNTCNMVITLNYDGANNDPQVVENCVFENNTCNTTAVLYYVKGAGCTVSNNKFVGNTVTVTDANNGATLYMGFTENNVITNNVFKNNTMYAGTSKRVAGGLMIGYDAVITGNAFVDNVVNGQNAKGNDVCASVYYTDIDLSGNYWGGSAPIEDDDYFVEYPDNHNVIINDYLTSYSE